MLAPRAPQVSLAPPTRHHRGPGHQGWPPALPPRGCSGTPPPSLGSHSSGPHSFGVQQAPQPPPPPPPPPALPHVCEKSFHNDSLLARSQPQGRLSGAGAVGEGLGEQASSGKGPFELESCQVGPAGTRCLQAGTPRGGALVQSPLALTSRSTRLGTASQPPTPSTPGGHHLRRAWRARPRQVPWPALGFL